MWTDPGHMLQHASMVKLSGLLKKSGPFVKKKNSCNWGEIIFVHEHSFFWPLHLERSSVHYFIINSIV